MRCSCTPSRIQSHHPELAAFLSSTGRTCCPSMIGWICDRSKSFAARRVVMKVSSGGKRRARLAYDSKPRRKCEISTMGPSFSLCLYSLALRHSFLPFSSLFLPFWCSKIKWWPWIRGIPRLGLQYGRSLVSMLCLFVTWMPLQITRMKLFLALPPISHTTDQTCYSKSEHFCFPIIPTKLKHPPLYSSGKHPPLYALVDHHWPAA